MLQRRETLPPSLLFAGPSGIGKRRVAIAFAQTINCTAQRRDDAIALDACGTCPACGRIARGVHPDVVLVEPGDSGSIKIEQVREVIDQVGYRPFEKRRRVVVVDETDTF